MKIPYSISEILNELIKNNSLKKDNKQKEDILIQFKFQILNFLITLSE